MTTQYETMTTEQLLQEYTRFGNDIMHLENKPMWDEIDHADIEDFQLHFDEIYKILKARNALPEYYQHLGE